MTEAALDKTHPYTLHGITQTLGITRHAIQSLVELGFVAPQRGPNRSWRFSFRDVVLLRTAHELRQADIPTRQILKSMRSLKSALPQDAAASGMRIKAVGKRVAVRWGDAQWDADTGQLMMDFAPGTAPASVHALARPKTVAALNTAEQAEALFAKAEALEESDSKAAQKTYRQLLAIAPDHADAYANLGYLLCESERFDEAAALYDQAVDHCPGNALLLYNRGVALEGAGRGGEALASYEECLRIEPAMADAHQNAGLLYAQAGHKQLAIRHFSAYRRLQAQS